MNNLSVQVGWLGLSDSEQRRAREYLRQFRTEGTLDEPGFGIVRDALADVFFLATNTVMTRSRYLFFVEAALPPESPTPVATTMVSTRRT